MQYCCHVWAGENGHAGLLFLHWLAPFKPLTHLRNASSLFYRYYFGRCSSVLTQLVPLTGYSRGKSTRYCDRLHDFLVTIPRC